MNDRTPERALTPPEGRELSEAELTEARNELCEDIITHRKTICGWDLAACIECELNASEDFARNLANVNGGLYNEGAACYLLAMDQFYTQIVSKHLPEEMVEARAMRTIRNEREEHA